MEYRAITQDEYISHYGVMGMRWGHRKDGGPQGYLGTYPKGGTINAKSPSIKVNDGNNSRFLTKNQKEFDKKLYAYYAQQGITKDMVNVNKLDDNIGKTYDRINNCALTSVAAMFAYEGYKCKAGGSITGNHIGATLKACGISPKKVKTYTLTYPRNVLYGYDILMSALRRQDAFSNTHGVVELETSNGGHAIYYKKDKSGNIAIFDPQNPNRNVKNMINLYASRNARINIYGVDIGTLKSKNILNNAKNNGILLKDNDRFKDFKDKKFLENYAKNKTEIQNIRNKRESTSNTTKILDYTAKINKLERKNSIATIDTKKFKKIRFDVKDQSVYEKVSNKLYTATKVSAATTLGFGALFMALPEFGVPIAAIAGGSGVATAVLKNLAEKYERESYRIDNKKLKTDKDVQKNIDKILDMVKELEKEK